MSKQNTEWSDAQLKAAVKLIRLDCQMWRMDEISDATFSRRLQDNLLQIEKQLSRNNP